MRRVCTVCVYVCERGYERDAAEWCRGVVRLRARGWVKKWVCESPRAVSLPEWSKGLRSGRNVFERVGSNPTADKALCIHAQQGFINPLHASDVYVAV